MKELVDYADTQNVGIILGTDYYTFNRDMEKVYRYFVNMGVN